MTNGQTESGNCNPCSEYGIEYLNIEVKGGKNIKKENSYYNSEMNSQHKKG